MSESIFKNNLIEMLNQNANKPFKETQDNSIYQISDSITDKEIKDYIKKMRGGKDDNKF